MISPAEFMLYVTPIVLLIDRLVGEHLARARAERLAETTKATASVLADTTKLESLRLSNILSQGLKENAEESAQLTVDKMEEPGGKMDEIHGLTNGNLSIANAKIDALQAECDRLRIVKMDLLHGLANGTLSGKNEVAALQAEVDRLKAAGLETPPPQKPLGD